MLINRLLSTNNYPFNGPLTREYDIDRCQGADVSCMNMSSTPTMSCRANTLIMLGAWMPHAVWLGAAITDDVERGQPMPPSSCA